MQALSLMSRAAWASCQSLRSPRCHTEMRTCHWGTSCRLQQRGQRQCTSKAYVSKGLHRRSTSAHFPAGWSHVVWASLDLLVTLSQMHRCCRHRHSLSRGPQAQRLVPPLAAWASFSWLPWTRCWGGLLLLCPPVTELHCAPLPDSPAAGTPSASATWVPSSHSPP